MIAIVRLNYAGEGISGEICANPGFDFLESADITSSAEGVSADPKTGSDGARQLLGQIRLIAEQLVLVHQFDSAGQEIFLVNREYGLDQIGIRVASIEQLMIASPDQAGGP